MKTLLLSLSIFFSLIPNHSFASALKIQDGDQYFTPSLAEFRVRVDAVRYSDPKAYQSMSSWLSYWETRESRGKLGYGLGIVGFVTATLAPVLHYTSILGVGLTGVALFLVGHELSKNAPGEASWVEFVNLHNAELPDRPWRIVGG